MMTQNLIAGKKRSQLVTGAGDDDVSDTLKMLNSVSTSQMQADLDDIRMSSEV